MSDVTRLLDAAAAGDHRAARDLLPVVYEELRRLAAAKMENERADHTLDATALVHEAYLKIGTDTFSSRSAFFRSAAIAMQRILVDSARTKNADKRGGNRKQFELSEDDRIVVTDHDTLLTIDEVLANLAISDPIATELARLRLFAGLTVEDAAETIGISRASAYRDWAYARAILTDALGGEK